MSLQAVGQRHFAPEMTPPPGRIDPLRKMIRDACSACEQVSEEELEQAADKPMVFAIGDRFRLDFTTRDFLLSFSQPNLYFHAATAYAILRKEGVPLGKREFLGALRVAQG